MSSKVVRVCVESLQGIVDYTSQHRLACEAASFFLAYLLYFSLIYFFAYLLFFRFYFLFLLIATSHVLLRTRNPLSLSLGLIFLFLFDTPSGLYDVIICV